MKKDMFDAYGQAMYDYWKHGGGAEIVERDDGYIEHSAGQKAYFTTYNEWGEHYKKALEHAAGRVLDIGCGAGRHSLYMQEKGHEVVGIDVSPLALQVCRERGLKNTCLMSIDDLPGDLEKFDTIIMMGNNFGLFGSFDKAKVLLGKFYEMTTPDARIIAETRDPYDTDMPEHIEYHKENLSKGRMSGQARLRIRYKKYATPYFDYLMVSREEMEKILEGTGWKLKAQYKGEFGLYTVVIVKEKN